MKDSSNFGLPPYSEKGKTRSVAKSDAHVERELATLELLKLAAVAEEGEAVLNRKLANAYQNPDEALENIEAFYHDTRGTREKSDGPMFDVAIAAHREVREKLSSVPGSFGDLTQKGKQREEEGAGIGRAFERVANNRESIARFFSASEGVFPSIERESAMGPYFQKGAERAISNKPLVRPPGYEKMADLANKDNAEALSGPEGRGSKEAEEAKITVAYISSQREALLLLSNSEAQGRPELQGDFEEKINEEVMERRVGASAHVLRVHEGRSPRMSSHRRLAGQALEDPERELLAHDLAHLRFGTQATKEAMGKSGFESVVERLLGDEFRREIDSRSEEIATGFLKSGDLGAKAEKAAASPSPFPSVFLAGNGHEEEASPVAIVANEKGVSKNDIIGELASDWKSRPAWDQRVMSGAASESEKQSIQDRAGRSHIVYQGRVRLAHKLSKAAKKENGRGAARSSRGNESERNKEGKAIPDAAKRGRAL